MACARLSVEIVVTIEITFPVQRNWIVARVKLINVFCTSAVSMVLNNLIFSSIIEKFLTSIVSMPDLQSV